MGRIIASLSDEGVDRALEVHGFGQIGHSREVDADQVRAAIRMRRLRQDYFEPCLCADPSWDMLLELMVARLERREMTVTNVCVASCVPSTTALRWINVLVAKSLVLRISDPDDKRQAFLRLSDRAASCMEAYFIAARRRGLDES